MELKDVKIFKSLIYKVDYVRAILLSVFNLLAIEELSFP